MVYLHLWIMNINLMIFDKYEMIFYSDINDLNEKLIFFKNDTLRIKFQKRYKKSICI